LVAWQNCTESPQLLANTKLIFEIIDRDAINLSVKSTIFSSINYHILWWFLLNLQTERQIDRGSCWNRREKERERERRVKYQF
jgi:hypothetical protein